MNVLSLNDFIHYNEKLGGKMTEIGDRISNNVIIKEYSQTLIAGETRLIFEGAAKYDDASVNVYSTKFGLNPDNIEAVNGDIIVDYPMQVDDLKVRVVLQRFMDPSLELIKTFTATLPKGRSTLIFSDTGITEDSNIEIFTDIYGVVPASINLEENGDLTLAFYTNQTSDMQVRLVVK